MAVLSCLMAALPLLAQYEQWLQEARRAYQAGDYEQCINNCMIYSSMNVSTVKDELQVKAERMLACKAAGTLNAYRYMVNRREIVANQAVMLFKQMKLGAAAHLADKLPNTEEYRDIKMFTDLETLFFKANKTPEEEQRSEQALHYAMQISKENKAVLSFELAPELGYAYEQVEPLVDSLSDNSAKKWYIKAMIAANTAVASEDDFMELVNRYGVDEALRMQENQTPAFLGYLQAALDIEESLDTLRYNKVIVATDADVDGMHIRLLIITFFLQFFPELIKKGHVYVLQTPLFRVRNRRTKIKNKKTIAEADAKSDKKSDFITRYCYSDEERQKAIEELGPDPEITRFKGLGEISPDEFAGFIGPDMRLEQVTLHKTDQVAKLLEYYMGKNTMERQNFIIDNLVVEEDRPEEDIYE